MVREEDGQPVWVDFGVGHLEGRTTLPRMWRLPPGTPEYTSPEAYRFLQEHPEEEARYQPGVADEVWAFGVTLYELLTDELPFGSRMSNPHMVKDIRTRTPRAPHESNPRVPVALGRVCMRMLEKEPGARLADMDAVAAALEEALAGADASWDVPLMDPDAPQVRTTEEIPGKVRGTVASGLLGRHGITTKDLSEIVTEAKGNALVPRGVYSYRAEDRVAVEVNLKIPGTVPWMAAGAVLRGPKGEVLKPLPLWQSQSLLPAEPGKQTLWSRVVVEIPASEAEARGTYTLTLWNADQKRTVTLGNVTFP